MQVLTGENHRAVLDAASRLLVVFEPVPEIGGSALLRAATAAAGEDWQLARVDAAAEPGIAALFGLDPGRPGLLVMREQVVLFCAPMESPEPDRLKAILGGAGDLNMAAVRRQLNPCTAPPESDGAALLARRVCPTAHLGRRDR